MKLIKLQPSFNKVLFFIFENRKSIFSFLIVGALSCAINLSSFKLLWHILNINYKISTSIAYVASVIFHFLANQNFTFKKHKSRFLPQITKYLTVVGINYIITLTIVFTLVEIFHLSPYLGIICAIGVTVNTGFIMSHFWVFRPALEHHS